MARLTPAYFFDEFLLPVSRKAPSVRERTLGLTVKDLQWLHTLYFANDAARQDKRLLTHPMRVEKLLINVLGQPPIALAGAFLMSPSPDGGKALLYTPYGGIHVFDNQAALLAEVSEQLTDPVQRVELMSFMSIAQRKALPPGSAMTLSSVTIEGAVFQDQEQTLQACQQANVQAMLDQLQHVPVLPDMLDTLLGIMGRVPFPGLDQRQTRVNCFDPDPTNDDRRWVDSLPLSEALLQFYVNHAWPQGQTREFFNPKHVTSAFSPAALAQDRLKWETLVAQTCDILSKLLDSLLQTYWNEDIDNGVSRLDLFAQVMAEKFRVDVLLKRQQQIISAEQSHMLQALFLPDQSARQAYANNLKVAKVRIYAPYQHYVEVASTLMITETGAYLYTQSRGLQVLANLDDLKDTLLSMLKAAGHEDELLNFLSLDERNIFIGLDQINIAARPVTGHIFSAMVEDIALKQISNMNHTLDLYRRSDGQVELAVLLDYALDVRAMLDDRLAALDTGGRWTVHPITSGGGRPSTVRAERAKVELQRLQAADDALASERRLHPTLRSMVGHALDAELHKQRLGLRAEDVYINTYATPAQEREERLPLSSLNMVEHFIERLGLEATAVPSSSRTWFYSKRYAGVALQLHNMTLSTFNTVIDNVLKVFATHDMRELPRLFLRNVRAKHAQSMLMGLRSEAQMRLLGKTLAPLSQAIVDTVIQPDSLTRVNRRGINGFLPDAYALNVYKGTSATALPLANTFVLTERGGIDPQRSGQAVLWTPRRGHEVFASVHALREAMQQRLEHPIQRLNLLENLPVALREPHQVYRLGPLQRIDDNLLENRLNTYRDRIMDGVEHLLGMGLGARALQNRLDTLIEQAAPTNLGRAMRVAAGMIEQQGLPVWLGMAPVKEQIHQAELMEQYHNHTGAEQDYLHGIMPIREHTFAALLALLQARFPGLALNPDNILIPVHHAFEIHDYNLTDFALRHWPDLNAENIQPRSRTAIALPPSLDANAVVQLVRQLDLKTAYQTQLQAQLDVNTDAGRTRRRLFCQQLPWQTLQYAHEQKLQERLSAQALNLVQQVFDMPDAKARPSLVGANAMIRPLELVATEGASAARVLGMYLIGPTSGSGPVVLYAPYSENHVLKEYADEQALLDELERPGALQDWVIRHLKDPHQATYRNLLKNNRHRPSDTRLASSAIHGNLLHRLFNDNTESLSKMLGCQFEAGAKWLWDQVIGLFSKEIPTAVRFMAGKLAYPLVVWRSYGLFKHSAEALQLHQWKPALKAFINGLAQLASLRGELEGSESPPPNEIQLSEAQLLDETLPAATTLANLDITAPWRTRLQAFENHDIALEDLERIAATHVYLDKSSARNYVPLAGKVYGVKKTKHSWRLTDGAQLGPYVGRNPQGHWMLDPWPYNPRYGKILSRYRTRREERHGINIQAAGLQEIAALSSWKAQVIDEALNVATYYAVTCKRNIVDFALSRAPDSPLGRFLGEIFGVVTLSPAQVQRIERVVDEILNELTDPTLTRHDSKRFVIGSTRTPERLTYAFTIPEDRERKLYLLDPFFYTGMGDYKGRLTTPFDLSAHARASTLIHELSHLRLDTVDIAYVDSMRPFPDLIDITMPRAQGMKTSLEYLRSTELSTLTPSWMLFREWNEFSGGWEEYGQKGAPNDVRKKILSLTGASNLVDARQVFMSNPDKRIDVILANADSVACLITQVGRRLEPQA